MPKVRLELKVDFTVEEVKKVCDLLMPGFWDRFVKAMEDIGESSEVAQALLAKSLIENEELKPFLSYYGLKGEEGLEKMRAMLANIRK